MLPTEICVKVEMGQKRAIIIIVTKCPGPSSLDEQNK
jgi:hypothetical protein